MENTSGPDAPKASFSSNGLACGSVAEVCMGAAIMHTIGNLTVCLQLALEKLGAPAETLSAQQDGDLEHIHYWLDKLPLPSRWGHDLPYEEGWYWLRRSGDGLIVETRKLRAYGGRLCVCLPPPKAAWLPVAEMENDWQWSGPITKPANNDVSEPRRQE